MRNRVRRVSLSRFAALAGPMLAAGALLAGCAPEEPPAEHAAPFVTRPNPGPASLSTIKSELSGAKTQLRLTTDALNALVTSSTGEAQANYGKYTDEYAKLKSKSDAVSARSADLKQRVSNYHALWREETGVVDPELRGQALQRQANAERLFGTINTELELVRDSFHPLMADLKELQIYFRDNFIPARLTGVADRVAKVNAEAREVDSHAAAILSAIDEITAATGETVAPTKVDAPR